MNSSSNVPRGTGASGGDAWSWRRRITAGQEDVWLARIGKLVDACALTGAPAAKRLLLSVYLPDREQAEALRSKWGGDVRLFRRTEWSVPQSLPPLRIGRAFEIVHDESARSGDRSIPRLHIPMGLAFGSGEHATTALLLRALAARPTLRQSRILDLGTGSGILALAARRLGAPQIVATDFDPDAVRTARQNEALNFSTPLIRWRRADVKRLRAHGRYDLVVANLFSGILCQAAAPIAASVAAGGDLWMSGILRAQEKEVAAAYRRQHLRLLQTTRRGKWVLLQWQKREKKV